MDNFIPGFIMAFREGLEAFLILALILKFLDSTHYKRLKINVIYGLGVSIIISLLLGFILKLVGGQFDKMEEIGKLWESLASLLAVGLIASFIVWMINHGSQIKKYVELKTSLNLTPIGIFIISLILIAREGVEIAIFTFAGQYQAISIVSGITLALLVSLAIYSSLFKISLNKIFQLTLIYLIIQAGYLFGYGIHEGLSALNALGFMADNNIFLVKLFDLSKTIFNHKEGIIGLPLNILFGWHAKPEWIQFTAQYLLTFGLFFHWFSNNKKQQKLIIKYAN